MSTQADILAAFRKGRFVGCAETPQEIETLLSHVFLSGDTAYKIYKEDSDYFNKNFEDLSDPEIRRTFIQSDFDWNHAATPEIYLSLQGALIEGASVVFCDPKESSHLIIVMRRFASNDGLLKHLVNKTVSIEDCTRMGRQLSDRLALVLEPLPGQDLYENFAFRFEDLRLWIAGLSDNFPKEEGESYVRYLENFLEANRAEVTKSIDASSTLDLHMENALYTEDTFLLIDTYPVKEEWRVSHRDFSIYRPAVDIYALAGEEAFRAFIKGYEEQSGRVFNKNLEEFFVVYVSSIMVPYLYVLGEKSDLHLSVAHRYHTFLREYFSRVEWGERSKD